MSFIFASSHLPEVERPQDEEEEDDDAQPMQRSGMVRAFSHLPQPVPRTAAAPRPPVPVNLPTVPGAGAGLEPVARSGGVSSGGLPAADDTRPWHQPPITLADLPPESHAEQEPNPGFGGPAPGGQSASHGTSSFAPSPQDIPNSDTSAAAAEVGPAQGKAPQHQGLWFKSRLPPGFRNPAAGKPVLNDLVQRQPTQDASTPAPGLPSSPSDPAQFHDLAYRTNGSPAEVKEHAQSLFQNVADVHGPSPQMAASADALAQKGGSQPVPGPVQPLDPKSTPQQPSQAVPAPSAAKAVPQQPSPSVADPLTKLKEHVAKSRNPIFIKDYYDEKTPLEEKLPLKQLLLSMKAPPGEKRPLPISNLQHWLNVENRPASEKEGPLEIPYSDLSKFGVMKDGGEKLLKYFGSLPDKQALEQKNMFDWLRSHPDTAGTGVSVPDTHWDTLVSGQDPGIAGSFGYARPGNEEFFYGLGGATLTGNSSGIKGSVDKNNAARAQGNIVYTLKDRYDWNKNQGTTIPITMEMIQKYLPKGVPLITPKSKSIQINDSFFHDLEKRGHGRSFDVQSKSPPFRYEFIQPKPGQPPTHRLIPTPSTGPLQFEGPGVHL